MPLKCQNKVTACRSDNFYLVGVQGYWCLPLDLVWGKSSMVQRGSITCLHPPENTSLNAKIRWPKCWSTRPINQFKYYSLFTLIRWKGVVNEENCSFFLELFLLYIFHSLQCCVWQFYRFYYFSFTYNYVVVLVIFYILISSSRLLFIVCVQCH